MRSVSIGGSSSSSTSPSRCAIFLGDRLAGAAHVLGAGKLVYADRGGDVRHVVLVARREDAIVPTSIARVPSPGIVRESVQRQQSHARGQLGVGGDGHPAFTGRDRLVGIEREARDGGGLLAAMLPRLFRPPPPGGRKRVCRVFDNPEVVARRKRLDRRRRSSSSRRRAPGSCRPPARPAATQPARRPT